MAAERRGRLPSAESVFVAGVWGAMFFAGFLLVMRYGPTIPVGDDYALVAVLTGHERLTPASLWAQHNEHRLPLPRLLLVAADFVVHRDARAGMVLSVLLLGFGAGVLMIGAANARGSWQITDALFPIALLHFGHQNNLLWSWQVAFTSSTALAAAGLALVAARGDRLGPREFVAFGLILALLPLCGANGLAFVPPVALWLVALGLARRKPAPILAALPGACLTLLYFVGYARPKEIDQAPGLAAIGRTALQFLSLSVGPVGTDAWRLAGYSVLVLALVTASALLVRAWRHRDDRPRAFGLLAWLAGLGVLTLGLASGRAGSGDRAGLEDRYITLVALIPCVAALVAASAPQTGPRRFLSAVLFTGACVGLGPNTTIGLQGARDRSSRSEAVVADLQSGLPMYRVIRSHTPWVHPSHDVLGRCWPMLQKAGRGPFRALEPDPPLRAVPFADGPASMRMARWDAPTRTLTATSLDPWAVFDLPARAYVAGIRMTYDHANGLGGPSRFKLGWRRSDQPGFPADQEHARWNMPTGEGRSATIWIGEPIDQFRIQPDNRPATFRLRSIELLEPSAP